MSLFKNPDGMYEADVRVAGVGRWHGSMRTRKRAEAEPRYHAVRRLFREAKGPSGAERLALIEDLRSGALTIERLESMVAHGEPLRRADTPENAAWPTVDRAIEEYLEWVQANPKKSHSTWKTARAQLRRFAAFEHAGVRLGSLPLDRVTSLQIEAYQGAQIAAKVPVNSLTAYMTRVGALWSWVQRRENRSANETQRIAALLHSPIDPETAARGASRRDRWLTYAEAERLLAATPDLLACPVALGLFAGLRAGEMLHLRPGTDIDLDLGTISIQIQPGWRPKTTRAVRVVPIAPPLRPLLERHLAAHASEDWMLPAIEDRSKAFDYWSFRLHFQRIVEAAELVTGRRDPRGVIYHTLRHTFASWLVQRGVDLYTVAQLLGDTLKTVEDTYAHLAPDYKRRAIAALEGAISIQTGGDDDESSATSSATTETY